MNSFPWLTVAGGIPLLGALVLALVAVGARRHAHPAASPRATGWSSSWRWRSRW